MRTQTIGVVLEIPEDGRPYNPVKDNGYNELHHFFEDIGYSVLETFTEE